ncbi:MAG: hypothetical protein M3P08_21255 [Thermoproteota archaeon]|nr:hypothetical protein [Thermoproteota archaeon]
MVPQEKMVYLLAALILSTAITYFLATWQGVVELSSQDTVPNEKLGGQMEIALFTIVGSAYASMSIWILKKRLYTTIPYIITAAGSAFLIGIKFRF